MCWCSVWLFWAGKDICSRQGGEKSTGGSFITERRVESNFTKGMQFYFYSFFCLFYFIKKILLKYFGYDDLLLLVSGVRLSLPFRQDIRQNLEKFNIKFLYGDLKSKSLAPCRALKWFGMKKKSTRHIPNDEESHQLKATLGNYQSCLFNNYKLLLTPLAIDGIEQMVSQCSLPSYHFFWNFTYLLIVLVAIRFIIVHIQRILGLDFRQICSCSSQLATATTRTQVNDGNTSWFDNWGGTWTWQLCVW